MHGHGGRAQFRIIGGRWRGRRLKFVPRPGLRPTPDRVRETLFNWLSPLVPGARCLDLFAGSGALGLEALSRGAARVDFVDRDPTALRRIDEHLVALGADNGHTCCVDWRAFLRRPVEPFDLIFADPPFASDYAGQLCTLLASSSRLAAGGRLYVEYDGSTPFEPPPPWIVHRRSRAGQVACALLKLPAP